jgi:hypothetical protein
MAPPEKESESSGITGFVAAVGIVCSFVGAVVGAVGYHLWKNEAMQQEDCSHSRYVTYSEVKVGFAYVASQLWKVSRENK